MGRRDRMKQPRSRELEGADVRAHWAVAQNSGSIEKLVEKVFQPAEPYCHGSRTEGGYRRRVLCEAPVGPEGLRTERCSHIRYVSQLGCRIFSEEEMELTRSQNEKR